MTQILKENGKTKAAIEVDGNIVEFLTMRNGRSWTGQPMSPALARLSIEVLEEYLTTVEKTNA